MSEQQNQKRKRKEVDEESAKKSGEITHRWIDSGEAMPDGRVEHDSVELTVDGKSFVIKKGGNVQLWNENQDESDKKIENSSLWNSNWCAKVESIWEDPPSRRSKEPQAKFRARWFYQKRDIVDEYDGDDFEGNVSLNSLVDCLTPIDLVLTDSMDDNNIETISGPLRLFYRRPDDELDVNIPKDARVCRYSLQSTAESNKMNIVPYQGKNDDLAAVETDDIPMNENTGSVSSPEESESESSGVYRNPVAPEAEGSTTSGQIRVGPMHQVEVPPYVEQAQKILSRNPTMVWKPQAISEEVYEEYLEQASNILTPFAMHNNFTIDDPFTALPQDQLEEFIQLQEIKLPLMVSSVSTSSSLSVNHNGLVRECDVDKLIENLSRHGYDVDKALETIEDSPESFLTTWDEREKELFDSGFRRYTGSLRMIQKTVGSSKSFQDVIDYHYRFKIPDQFRKFQEKKREQAVRIMECIEARRLHDCVVHAHTEQNRSGDQGEAKRRRTNWSETGTREVIGAVAEKRVAAKKLLIEIEKEMGRGKMSEVAGMIMSLHQNPETEVDFTKVLKDHPDLLQRFNEFLPARLRN